MIGTEFGRADEAECLLEPNRTAALEPRAALRNCAEDFGRWWNALQYSRALRAV